MNEKDQRQLQGPTHSSHASARLISPIFLAPPLPDVETLDYSSSVVYFSGDRLQSQVVDTSANQPTARRQNTACDACRTRKARCHQLPGQDKCQRCLAKNYPCTYLVQQASQDRKRGGTLPAKPRRRSLSNSLSPITPITSTPTSFLTTNEPGPSPSPSTSTSQSAQIHTLSPPTTPPADSGKPTMDLLLWLFGHISEDPMPQHIGDATYQAARSMIVAAASVVSMELRNGPPTAKSYWGEIGMTLRDEAFIVRFSLDLIEAYMRICHARQPILDPVDFRARFKLSLPAHLQPPDTPNPILFGGHVEPLPPALLSIVLAWGSKFSEHPLLLRDREENDGRSRLSRMLVTKSLEVAEGERVYRLPSTAAILTCLVVEGIETHAKGDPNRYTKFWVDSAIRLMLDLEINRHPDGQATLVFCWLIACLSDAIGSAHLRRKPLLDDDDYDSQYLVISAQLPQVLDSSDPVVPLPVQATYLDRYGSLHALARIIRQMCRVLWIPATKNHGIPFERLVGLVTAFFQWRDDHLARVGVPSNLDPDWDFVAAVTACSSDATFHVMWIILSQALEEYGIKESNDIMRGGGENVSISTGTPVTLADCGVLSSQIINAAQHGALRIAGLAGMLVPNKYLRLDPNVLHHALYAAGHMLARAGRSEVQMCIAGLNQYGMAYEDAFDQAEELEKIYASALSNGPVHNAAFASSPAWMARGALPYQFTHGIPTEPVRYASNETSYPDSEFTVQTPLDPSTTFDGDTL